MTMIQHRDPGDKSEAAMTDKRAAVELEACPFCGGEVKLYREPYCGGQHAGIAPLGLLCTGCRTTHFLGAEMSQTRLKKVWNTRPIEDTLRAENTELSARVSELTRLLAEAESGLRYAYVRLPARAAFAARPAVQRAARGEIGEE